MYKPGSRVGKGTYQKRKQKLEKETQAAITAAVEAERSKLLASQQVANQLCHARVWAGGLGSQCIRVITTGKHCEKHTCAEQRIYGDVTEPVLHQMRELHREKEDFKQQLRNLQDCRDWVSTAIRSGMQPPPTAQRRIRQVATQLPG